jgi:hypothetical protein
MVVHHHDADHLAAVLTALVSAHGVLVSFAVLFSILLFAVFNSGV